MKRVQALEFADQLRSAREAALKDAEAFDGIIHTIERLGSHLTGTITALHEYRDELEKLALSSSMAEEVPLRFRSVLTPFSQLYDMLKLGRNDALHQGAFARHLTSHAVQLALILEDALRSFETPLVSDYMVRNPVCAELWHPLGFIRQQMLMNSFSFLPVLDGENWSVVSDREVAIFLRDSISVTKRKSRLALPLVEATQVNPRPVSLTRTDCLNEEDPLAEALRVLTDVVRDAPVLVRAAGTPQRLAGILTAFDLL